MTDWTGEKGKPKIKMDRPHSVFRAADDIGYKGFMLKCADMGVANPYDKGTYEDSRKAWVAAGKPKKPQDEETE